MRDAALLNELGRLFQLAAQTRVQRVQRFAQKLGLIKKKIKKKIENRNQTADVRFVFSFPLV